MKTPERLHRCRFGVFIVNIKHISHFFHVFLLLTLNFGDFHLVRAIKKDEQRSQQTRYPANIYLFKDNNRKTRKRCDICSTLTIKTPEQRQWRRCSGSVVIFEHIFNYF